MEFAEIRAFEAHLRKSGRAPSARFGRQYVGGMREAREVLDVTFFCERLSDIGWHERIVAVASTSDCVGNARYDPGLDSVVALTLPDR